MVISDRLWRQRLGADPGMVGRNILLSGTPYEVIGVMPADFRSPNDYVFGSRTPDIWTARPITGTNPGSRSFRAVARLRPGVSVAQANAELDALRQRIGEQFPDWAKASRIVALPLQAQVTGEVRPVLVLLAVTAALVLLIGCANLANLVLVRGLTRAREMEVRAAMGAGTIGALRPLVLEVFVLGLVGAMAGLALAAAGLGLVVSVAPAGLPRLDGIALDARMVLAAFAFALTIAALAGVVPALRLAPSRRGAGGLAGSTRGASQTRSQQRAQAAFAVAQLALSLAVLSGAALLLRSFLRLSAVDPGFRADGVYATQIDLPATRYPDGAAQRRFIAAVTEGLMATPGITGAGFVSSLPQHGLNNFSTGTPISGRPDDAQNAFAFVRAISIGYLDAMGITVRRGRGPQPGDWIGDSMQVAFVNDEYARRFFATGNVLGQHVNLMGNDVEIAGVVSNTKYSALSEDWQPEIYAPTAFSTMFLVARSSGGAAAGSAAIRRVVHDVDALLPLDILAERQLLDASSAESRFALLLLGLLAAIGTVLSGVGLYGVVSCAVSERRREFGIRMAVGATESAVVAVVLRRGLLIALTGTALGLGLALSQASLLRGMLFGISPRDPLALISSAALLSAIALLASWRPARRAARMDPAATLRVEA